MILLLSDKKIIDNFPAGSIRWRRLVCQGILPFTLPLSPWSPLKNTNINNLAHTIIPILIVGLIYEDALLVFYIHSAISQLSYPLHQHHQKGRNTRRSPSRFLQWGSTAPHEVKNTKNNFIQPRNMWH